MLPPLGVSKPASMRSSVVLPQPDGPSSAKNSFSRMSSETPSTAATLPKFLVTPSIVEKRARIAHGATVPRLSRCDSVSAMTLTAMTMVASALISGVMPKRIIE